MATLLFANNIQTTLTTSITSSQTSVTLASTAGLPSPSAGQYFVMTFTNGNINEIVWVTNVTGSTITCIRAREGTNGSSFASGSYASCFPTAGTQQDFVQIDQLQNGAYTFTNGAGTANALTASIASNLTATSLPNGFQFVLNAANANTGAATLNLTLNPVLPGSGATTSTGALPIYQNGTFALTGGEISGSNYLCLFTYNSNYNGGLGAFVLENPYNPVTGVVGITQVQDQYFIYNTSGGSTDALTLTVPAGLGALTDGAVVVFRNATSANTTTTPTLNVTYGSTATGATVIKKYNNLPLSIGDTGGVGYVCQLVYSSSASAWMLLNPAPGAAGGVTGLTAGNGITVSSPSGNVTISNSGVLSINGATGNVAISATSISALNTVQSAPQTVASPVTFNGSITTYGQVTTITTPVGNPGVIVQTGSQLGQLSCDSLQLYSNGTGFYSNGTTLSIGFNGTFVATIDNAGNSNFVGNNQGLNITALVQGYKPGGGSWATYSDERLKSNITPLIGSLDKIISLKPVSYTWNYENKEPTVGFIAQDVEKVLPNAITYTKSLKEQKPFIDTEEVLTIGWQNDMFAYLVGSIKELNDLVQTQAAQIAALNKKVKL